MEEGGEREGGDGRERVGGERGRRKSKRREQGEERGKMTVHKKRNTHTHTHTHTNNTRRTLASSASPQSFTMHGPQYTLQRVHIRIQYVGLCNITMAAHPSKYSLLLPVINPLYTHCHSKQLVISTLAICKCPLNRSNTQVGHTGHSLFLHCHAGHKASRADNRTSVLQVLQMWLLRMSFDS